MINNQNLIIFEGFLVRSKLGSFKVSQLRPLPIQQKINSVSLNKHENILFLNIKLDKY